LAAHFEPANYKDNYRESVRSLIDAKIRGDELKLGAMAWAPPPVTDILEALKASLARAKKPAEAAHPQPISKRPRKAIAS
jgi:DNA end-binding protein Ku